VCDRRPGTISAARRIFLHATDVPQTHADRLEKRTSTITRAQ
jgi:hypothetical protein